MGYWGNPGIGPQDLRENTVDKHIKMFVFSCLNFNEGCLKIPVHNTSITKHVLLQYLGLTGLGFYSKADTKSINPMHS